MDNDLLNLALLNALGVLASAAGFTILGVIIIVYAWVNYIRKDHE